MHNKPMDMVINFSNLDEIMAWIDYAKSMRFKPKSVTISLQDVVFGLPTDSNSAIDAMVAKAAAAIDSATPITLTADAMRELFGEYRNKHGTAQLLEKMGKHGGSRLNEIAETEWPALAQELRDA